MGLANFGARFHDRHRLAVEAAAGMAEFIQRGIDARGARAKRSPISADAFSS